VADVSGDRGLRRRTLLGTVSGGVAASTAGCLDVGRALLHPCDSRVNDAEIDCTDLPDLPLVDHDVGAGPIACDVSHPAPMSRERRGLPILRDDSRTDRVEFGVVFNAARVRFEGEDRCTFDRVSLVVYPGERSRSSPPAPGSGPTEGVIATTTYAGADVDVRLVESLPALEDGYEPGRIVALAYLPVETGGGTRYAPTFFVAGIQRQDPRDLDGPPVPGPCREALEATLLRFVGSATPNAEYAPD
jgi:hypothetical protein